MCVWQVAGHGAWHPGEMSRQERNLESMEWQRQWLFNRGTKWKRGARAGLSLGLCDERPGKDRGEPQQGRGGLWGSPRCGAPYLGGLQGLNLPWQLHSVPVKVVHGDGVVPVAQVVLGVGCLLLPPHAAHCQQDGCGESARQRGR